MKKKLILCDICYRDITDTNRRFSFREYYYDNDFFEFQCWHKRDMCEECFYKIQDILQEHRLSIDAENYEKKEDDLL